MKRFALALAATAALTGQGFAADMAVKARPLPPPVFSWTGCYIGANVGGVIGNDRVDTRPSGEYNRVIAPALLRPGFVTIDSDDLGFTGGGQIGCNYQTGTWVFGIEGDINGSTLRESTTTLLNFGVGGSQTITKDLDWWGTVRGRAGFALDRAFFYGTGGVAFARYKSSYTISFNDASTFAGSDAWTSVGWVAGVGVEYAFAPNWTIKGEYLYMDLGGHTYDSLNTLSGGGPVVNPGFTFTADLKLREQIGRIGINYKFGAPVGPKY